MSITNTTKLTAIIGNPVTHSLSPLLHNAIYENEKVDAVMLAFGSPDVAPLVAAIRALPIHLTAVTMPHKQSIIPLLDEIDTAAREIGAVNTVINDKGKLRGFNTDIIGVAAALRDTPLKGQNALLVGAGGAARPVAYQLSREGANLFCHNRDVPQAEELCKKFGGTVLPADKLGPIPFSLIINATPVGMKPDVDAMPIPEDIIRPGAAVFDLVYSPLETKLLKTARAKGARAISGITMFLAQGLEQERLWLGKNISDSNYAHLLEEKIETL